MAFFQAHPSALNSDAAAEFPRRGSLPRLGSMSSFQNLNPFHRRRIPPPPICTTPTDIDNTRVPWSSQDGHRKSSATALRPKKQGGLDKINASLASQSASATCGHGDNMDIPIPTTTQSLPRSRTFSHLPISTRLRMTAEQMPVPSSQAHFGYSRVIDCPAETPLAVKRFGDRSIQPSLTSDCKHVEQTYSTSFGKAPVKAPVPPMQRWNSQPLLSNTTNIRQSHGEIKQTRLMSVRQAPTPPIAHTGLTSNKITDPTDDDVASRSKRDMFLRRAVVRKDSAVVSLSPRYPPQVERTTGLPKARVDLPHSAARIEQAEPCAYWSGRFSALVDRMCNRELEQLLDFNSNSSRQEISQGIASQQKTWQASSIEDLHSSEATLTRTKHALQQLHSLCVTEEAKQSFHAWLTQLESSMKEPEISKLVETLSTKISQKIRLEQDKENQPAPGEMIPCEAIPAGHRAKLVYRWLGKGKK